MCHSGHFLSIVFSFYIHTLGNIFQTLIFLCFYSIFSY